MNTRNEFSISILEVTHLHMAKVGLSTVKFRDNGNGRKYSDLTYAILGDMKAFDIECTQIFTHGPRTTSANNLDRVSIAKLASNKFPIYCHTCYACLPWNDEIYRLKLCESEMKAAAECKARGVVIHLPIDTVDNIYKHMVKITKIAEKYKVLAIIEPPARKTRPGKTFESTDVINALTEKLLDLPNWKWCLDTAHIWSTGGNIRNYEDAKNWLKALKYPKTIELFHLNGSHRVLASGNDKHAVPFLESGAAGPDLLWGNFEDLNLSGGYVFIRYAKKYGINMILESNFGTDAEILESIEAVKKIRSL